MSKELDEMIDELKSEIIALPIGSEERARATEDLVKLCKVEADREFNEEKTRVEREKNQNDVKYKKLMLWLIIIAGVSTVILENFGLITGNLGRLMNKVKY